MTAATSCPLLTRKTGLRRIMPKIENQLRYLDHVEGQGSRVGFAGVVGNVGER